MLVLGHRGYHADVPENTMESFDRAIAMGVDGIETDVRVSADGVAILFHNRCVTPKLAVSQLTHLELQKLCGYPVPTLEDAISGWPDVFWNLELKTSDALEPTVAVISRFASTTKFLVTSFLHQIVYRILRRVDVKGGLLFAHLPKNLKLVGDACQAEARIDTVVWDFDACSGDLVRLYAEGGYKNFVYGPITPREHQEVLSWKADGIITDYPEHSGAGGEENGGSR